MCGFHSVGRTRKESVFKELSKAVNTTTALAGGPSSQNAILRFLTYQLLIRLGLLSDVECRVGAPPKYMKNPGRWQE